MDLALDNKTQVIGKRRRVMDERELRPPVKLFL
jgi:hypothetical protein